jgi:ferritin-like metal-binding protein YciE
MSDRKETLQQYVSDMLALERHIHEAVRRQRDDSKVSPHVEAHQLISRIEAALDEHIEHLEEHLESLGGEPTSPVKDAVSAVAGVAAGVYDKMRSDPVSKMLRDDYTALSLAAISYTMLHTTGLAMTDHQTAEIALEHLGHWTPLIVEISEVVPLVVARELADEGGMVNAQVGQEAVRNTQQAWSPEAISTF